LFSTCFSKSFFATNYLGSTNNFISSSIDKGNAVKPHMFPSHCSTSNTPRRLTTKDSIENYMHHKKHV
jgi:hypothetical protein